MNHIHLSPPHLGEEERRLLLEALDSNWIAPVGPDLTAFEAEVAEMVGAGTGVALSSGTAALHLGLVVAGVGRGDEVLVSTLTFAAPANAVAYVGGRPVFLDSEESSWNLDPGLLEEELEERARRGRLPRAVIAVDLYGQCADYDAIIKACRRWDVPVIEDAAEALGSDYRGRPAGSLGDLSILSFNGNKIITTSGGGMLLSSNRDWVERARYLSTQARQPAPHYEHTEVGFNYRLSNLLAAVGRGQLCQLHDRVRRRRAINRFYRSALADLDGIRFMPSASYGRSNCWLTCITIDPEDFGASREDVRMRLAAGSVEARPTWKPMHLQPAFAGLPVRGGCVSERIFERGLCLPSGSTLTALDVERVIEIVRSVAS